MDPENGVVMAFYLGSSESGSTGQAAIIGVPYDGISSHRAGSNLGPGALRNGSRSLETYSPFLHRDLNDIEFIDCGDLDVPSGDAVKTVAITADQVRKTLSDSMQPVLLGGEHTVTLGAVQALVEIYPDLHLLQLDAHTGLRNVQLGEQLGHSSVMRRIMEIIPSKRIHRLGIRSGTREELELANLELSLENCGRDIEGVLMSIPSDAPLYISLDLDVFDPSLVPGVGNPEPLGMTYREFINLVRELCRYNVVGFDVVELSPKYDPSDVSAIVAASTVRELLLCMTESHESIN